MSEFIMSSNYISGRGWAAQINNTLLVFVENIRRYHLWKQVQHELIDLAFEQNPFSFYILQKPVHRLSRFE